MIHVNSDFTDMAGRASDHDPILAQIDFTKQINKQKTEVTIDAKKSWDDEIPSFFYYINGCSKVYPPI